MPSDLFFIGQNHGGVAALSSLQEVFSSVEICSQDHEILNQARPTDSIVNSAELISSPTGVMAGHLGILSQDFLENHQVINVHYSLLPKYRGLHSVVWAMINLEPLMGLTYHIANQFIDDGPIIYQHSIKNIGQTSSEFMQLFDDHVQESLGEVVQKWVKGSIKPVKQDKDSATWVPRRNLDDCLVDFNWPYARLSAFFKALVPPYPRPIIQLRNKRYEIADSKIIDRPYFCQPGHVVNIDTEGVWIKCADSLLIVSRLIDEQNRALDARGILKVGMRLR